jgi:para-nitrobenzyl esterase
MVLNVKGELNLAAGRVRGVQRDGLWTFSGIPYARAPEGELRWRAPQPPLRWNGVRDATAFGPMAPQPVAQPGITSPSDPDAAAPQSEDCLTLNVWTQNLSYDDRPAPGRPVMVWIHGGGFTSGSGSVFLYRGARLARAGGVVVVTINYRLGALGLLGHRALADEEGRIGNWGLQDQVAALEWVQDHIALFGGDPRRVTVFGESAGAFSIAALMGAPQAAGLFQRAVIQSGGVHVHTVDEAERTAGRLVAALGVESCDREHLGRVPAAELVAATEEIGRGRPDPGLIPLPFLPVVDGTFLPVHPLRAVGGGSARGVDLLIGTNRDELTLFSLGRPEWNSLDEDTLLRWVANSAPDVPTDELIDNYRQARRERGEPTDPRSLWVALGSDGVFRWPSLELAAAQGAQEAATFAYFFEWPSPAFGGMLGACHALEVPFVFGVVDIPAVQLFTGGGPAVETLSSQMQGAWVAFAYTGDPSHPGIGTWRAWHPRERATMMFGADTSLGPAPRDRELAVWERYRPFHANSFD